METTVDKPSPSREALRQGITKCRRSYPNAPWPAQTDRDGWGALAQRWTSGCYGMTDEVFLQAVDDHLAGPYKQFAASPGQLWVAYDLRQAGLFNGDWEILVEPAPPEGQPLEVLG